MSYSIYFKSMFLRIGNDKYLPMFETAESNVWSASNPRQRSKEWGNTKFACIDNKILLTKEEILSIPYKIEDKIKEKHSDYNGNNFGYLYGLAVGNKSTLKTTFNDYKNLFKNGLKNAIDFEVLRKFNITIYGYRFSTDGAYHYIKYPINNEQDVISLCENEPNVWFSFLKLDEEKYKYIKMVINYKPSKNKALVIQTNLGYIKSFDNNLMPEYTENEKEAALFTKSEANAIFDLGIRSLGKDLNELGIRELSRCYR